MAGGAITAYANATDLPVLHTVHNVFTADLPLDLLTGVNLRNSKITFLSEAYGRNASTARPRPSRMPR